MSDTDNQDFYEGSAADAPLIDSLGSAVKRLIDKGKVRGYITVEELNKALPPEKESSEQIEDIMSEISDMGISIIILNRTWLKKKTIMTSPAILTKRISDVLTIR